MDTQKTLVKVLELFRILAILYCLSWVIFAATTFYYIDNQHQPPQPAFFCGVIDNMSMNLSELGTKGETLFKSNCAQCHSPTTKQIVGQGLAGIESR
jgi:hypothetical protein